MGLDSKQPLFREFCRLNNLHDGDCYSAADYINYVDSLSLAEQLGIIRKYNPDFKLKNCNI